MGIRFHRAFIAYENMTRWLFYYDNPDCVQETINIDYNQSLSRVPKELNAEIPHAKLILTAAFVIVAQIGFVSLYFSKMKADAEYIHSHK